MGFYARALLRDSHHFGLHQRVEFAQAEGITIRVHPQSALEDSGWREAELWAPDAQVPVEIDMSRRDDPESLLHYEIAEFDDELADADEQTPAPTPFASTWPRPAPSSPSGSSPLTRNTAQRSATASSTGSPNVTGCSFKSTRKVSTTATHF